MKSNRRSKYLKNDCNTDITLNKEKKHKRKMNATKNTRKYKFDTVEVEEKELDKMDVPVSVLKQIENSESDLINYTEEGSQLVTNVHLANDNRENNRRETDKSERDIRLKAVELESEIANAKFMEISSQWPIILKKNDALEIHEYLELQKKRGLDLIEQKNQMIEILKRDLAESDNRFLQEQAAQSEDVRILQERIENQVKFMRKQYKNHIQYIKSTMDQEREYRIDRAKKGWENLYNKIILTETDSLNNRLTMIEKKENNIMKQYEMNEEIIRNLKSNMNTELNYLQREFELIKLKCVDNVEKLNYNYQVLKRREEENACAKAIQRRKINKLQDILSTKKKILRENKTDFKAKVPLLHDEIEKLKQDIERHEKKAERFAEIQEKTFKELWNFSQEQINIHLERIFKVDKFIHETQLSIDWQPPPKLKYLDVSDLPSYRKKPNTPNKQDNLTVDLRLRNDKKSVDSYTETRERALLQLVFDMTIKNSSFILDSELIEIIKSHPKNNLILLYNAMAAYGLNNIDSWRCLLSYAQTMVTCAICCGPIVWHKTDNINHSANIDSEWKPDSKNKLIDNILMFTENHTKYTEKTLSVATNVSEKKRSNNDIHFFKENSTSQLDNEINTIVNTKYNDYRSIERANTDSDNSTITFSLSLTDFEQLCSENDSNPAIKYQHSLSQVEFEHFQVEIEEQNDFLENTQLKYSGNIKEEKDPTIQKKLCDNPNHSLTISDTDYLRIIKKTIDVSKSKVLDQRSQNCSDFYLTNTLSIKDINDYWKQFMYAFPEDRLVLWDVFDKAIKKYYQTLHLRCKKMKEVEQLETENMELKKILKQFMDAEQDDVRLQKMCTPKIRKQQITSTKINTKPTLFTDNSNNICGTSMHIFTVNRPDKKKISRPFTAPTKS
ncbi:dynein regulatory complex protein 1 [Rhopalosiphum maidis]|uniref:dynein regulatory complex protein 1 n=1 Tax=Rhopalosiphum maidis TaxID=43146 RepID=UPI000EFF7E2F|nr:dynein regulatory complex protein 1 [Rhopalosiphum maidis]